jgi:hypothetical protein
VPLHRGHLLDGCTLLDDGESIGQRLRSRIFIDLHRRDPLAAVAIDLGEEDPIVGDVAEARRLTALEATNGLGRRDLAQQRDELRCGEGLLGHRMGGAALLQLGDVVLRQNENVGAVADHHGEKSVELSHVSREDARAR